MLMENVLVKELRNFDEFLRMGFIFFKAVKAFFKFITLQAHNFEC